MVRHMVRKVVVLALGGVLAWGILGVAPPARAATPIIVSGTITDQHGAPVPFAKVEAWGKYDRYDEVEFAATTSDGEGRYSLTFDPRKRVAGVTAWANHLHVSADGYWEPDYGITLPDYLPGDTVDLPFTMASRADLTGRVVDEEGRPVSGAAVWLHNVAMEGYECQDDDFICLQGDWVDDELTTDADGRFSRWTHPRDLIGVVVSAPGFEPRVVYDAVAEDDLTIELAPGDGELDDAVVQGVLRDSTGTPLPDHTVRLADQWWSPIEDTTDADGRYVLRFQPLYESYWTDGFAVVAWAAEIFEHKRVPFEPGASGYYEPGATYDVDVTLDAAGRVSGVVTDQAGTPLPGVVVLDAGATDPYQIAVTGPDGRYEFTTYAGGFLIDFVLDGYYDPEYSFSGTVAPGEALEVPTHVLHAYSPPGQVTRVRASARGPHRAVVRGRVSDDLGGTSLDRFAARCQGRGERWRVSRRAGWPVVVRRLEAGHRYHCQLRAHNDYGWSPWSTSSDWFRTPRR